jgi:hypothetical protein
VWTNLRSGDNRVSRRTFLSALAVLLGSSAGCSHPLPPPQGIVLQKGIFGERNNRRVPVLSVTNDTVSVQDDLLATVLPRSGELADTTVSASVHAQLEQRYDEIYYYVKMKKLSPNSPLIKTKKGKRPEVPLTGGTPRYLLSREAFGKLLVDDHTEYTLNIFDSDKITAITTILRKGVVQEKRPEPDTNPNTPQYRITVSHGKRANGDLVTLTYFADPNVYETAQVGLSTYFDVIFEDRSKPTIRTFTPPPYGNL